MDGRAKAPDRRGEPWTGSDCNGGRPQIPDQLRSALHVAPAVDESTRLRRHPRAEGLVRAGGSVALGHSDGHGFARGDAARARARSADVRMTPSLWLRPGSPYHGGAMTPITPARQSASCRLRSVELPELNVRFSHRASPDQTVRCREELADPGRRRPLFHTRPSQGARAWLPRWSRSQGSRSITILRRLNRFATNSHPCR